MSERMSEERLDEIGRKLGEWSSREDWRSVAAALLEDLKTSRAELTAARTVGLENYNRACRERDSARADALEEAAKVVDGLREKHGAPCGTQYAQGIWDQGARNAAAIRALKPTQALNAPEGK